MKKSNTEHNGLAIPNVPENLKLPVQCLAQAAYFFRGVLIEILEGATIFEALQGRGDIMLALDESINAWVDHLKLDENNCEDIS